MKSIDGVWTGVSMSVDKLYLFLSSGCDVNYRGKLMYYNGSIIDN